MEPTRTRPAGVPRFEIRQVLSDGTVSEPEFLSVLAPPWEAQADRRGFLRAGLTAGAVLALLAACGPSATRTPGGAGAGSTVEPDTAPSPGGGSPGSSAAASAGASPKATPTPKPTKSTKPKATKKPKPKPTKTPKPTPKPTGHKTCACHIVGGCSCNTVCTCNKICTCIPVCQAHRLLDPDPVIRVMAEEIVLAMGGREMAYLKWAADAADPPLADRVRAFMAEIRHGATTDPSRWPNARTCAPYLDHRDPVVTLMAAQMLDLHRTWAGEALGDTLTARVTERLGRGSAMRWRPPVDDHSAGVSPTWLQGADDRRPRHDEHPERIPG